MNPRGDWRELLRRGVEAGIVGARPFAITRREVEGQVALADANLRRAERFADDRDVGYRYLYEALVVLSDAVLAAVGYAIRGEGGHEASLGAVMVLFDEAAAKRWDVLIRRDMRRRRHELAYERLHAVDGEDLESARTVCHECIGGTGCRRFF